MELLIEHGYKIMLVGDRNLSNHDKIKYSSKIIDHTSVNIKRDLFYLFAGAECDISISETGGGAWLPVLNGIPSLLINGFPFGYGLPNSMVFYKKLLNTSGDVISYNTIKEKHTYDIELKGLKLIENNSDEIYSAIFEFLHYKNNNPVIKKNEIFNFPNYTWQYVSGSSISNEWLKISQ